MLYLGLELASGHACPQRPNPSRETVPLRQRKPREIQVLRYKIIGAPKKFKNWPLPLFRPRTNHKCHPKPNPSHDTDTVPLI